MLKKSFAGSSKQPPALSRPREQDLTDFGRPVVREMNRVGMVVDCAHSGIKSGLEAMKLSTKRAMCSSSLAPLR
jgi:membrane dipeptidase